MEYLRSMIFLFILFLGFALFTKSIKKIFRNIQLGKTSYRTDQKGKRWKTMLFVALGQSRMNKRPIAGFLHVLVYLGFVVVNIDFIEIMIDGVLGTNRFFSNIFPPFIYNAFTAILDIFALLVIISVIIFYIRRNILHIKRLNMYELKGWPKNDANYILIFEFLLMLAFLTINACESILQQRGETMSLGYFPVSIGLIVPIINQMNLSTISLEYIKDFFWWFHVVGVLFFVNYLYYSKHLHIFLAFPTTWFSNLSKKGKLDNLDAVTREVRLMLNPNIDPYAATERDPKEDVTEKFGASDIFDLTSVQLMSAYSCTECGRCTAVCPANITGKKLSPRKIMMDTRDRLEEVGRNIEKNGTYKDDDKKLLDHYIQREELRACTTCNACVEACPILIDPLSIIMQLRRYMIMEESSAPRGWNMMMTNIENNGAPWQYSRTDRLNWAKD
ncbi:MAG: 4Fe-4S dicluster domain-containing protein [Bergeyella sp.]|nr:4Fe-4S dicluster domain-containing protein [Bergeyella sp.]